ncbi:hypothetical protein [Siccirubricoccus sp. G192]|uniref:hypothetical protein n=1 Tax=Siccirubricoccus sp. G192 TaxID=2849651 RepID=UPI001C2BA600|nr:hypothetical protein [Siccirubricoccus sp. G192]MBV1798927.1 hypothetical protein [Siccirubricoccus sp. G192]
MSTSPHPAAPHHLPFYLPGPDGSDPVLVGTGIFLAVALLAFGLLFLRLHTLPERMAHRGNKLQFEIVAVLGLLALFTHMHIFWVAGLLLALIDLPDFTGPLRRIAGSAERVAGLQPGEGDTVGDGEVAGRMSGHGSAEERPDGHATDIAPPPRASEVARERYEA